MSLPSAQQRILNRIEDNLRASEPRLASMFGLFTRLTADELPPYREQLRRRGPRSILALLAGTVVVLAGLTLMLVTVTSGPVACGGPVIAYKGLVMPARGDCPTGGK